MSRVCNTVTFDIVALVQMAHHLYVSIGNTLSSPTLGVALLFVVSMSTDLNCGFHAACLLNESEFVVIPSGVRGSIAQGLENVLSHPCCVMSLLRR